MAGAGLGKGRAAEHMHAGMVKDRYGRKDLVEEVHGELVDSSGLVVDTVVLTREVEGPDHSERSGS